MYTEFGRAVIDLLDQRGWNSIPKRELTIHLIDLAAKSGLVDLNAARVKLAQQLMISPTTLEGLLRDRLLLTKQAHALDHQQFVKWAHGRNQTTRDDNEKGQITFSVDTLAEAIQVEAYLDELGVVPDYKNNRRLLVIDLRRLVGALAQKSGQSVTDLISTQEDDPVKRNDLLKQAEGSDRRLLGMLLKALREQADKHVGERTVDFALALIEEFRKKLGRTP